jgi:hypothetical protein
MNFLARLLGRSKPEAKDVVVEVIESVSELSSSSSSSSSSSYVEDYGGGGIAF